MNALRNCLLALGSVVVGLALCEAALRLLHPGYGHLAAPPRQAPGPAEVLHPDTGEPHAVVYNNLGGRQHRDFSERDLAEAVNLAFFGGSFTENLRMAAHYSFTEILDYLLNAQPDGEFGNPHPQGARYNVLNFGIDGTGPGEQYAHYRASPFKRRLQHVFYVHNQNDLADLRHAASWALNDVDQLVAQLRAETPLWKRLLARLHLSYLVLEARELSLPPEANVLSWEATTAVFDALLRTWREEVRNHGGVFHIVLPPGPDSGRWMEGKDAGGGWRVVGLHECFSTFRANLPDLPALRFRRDLHWNEAGNMLAAHCLYRYLEATFDTLPVRSDEDLAQMRHVYYAAFRDSGDWRGHRFVPGSTWARPGAAPGADVARRIVARYQALGGDAAERRERIVRTVRATAPVLRSVWNVHLDRERRLLVYVKAPCAEDDPAAGMFLRWRPWNAADLAPADRPGRYMTRRTALAAAQRHGEGERSECVVADNFPAVSLASIHTGQRAPGGEVLWQGEFAVDDADAFAAVVAADRREYDAVAATPPAARSVWNVHRKPAARELAYLKQPCRLDDTLGEFFLRVRPVEPMGETNGTFELPIKFHNVPPRERPLWRNPWRGRPGTARRATMFEGKCLMTVPLPDWPVGAVWTGGYGPDGNLWEERFYFDTDGLRRMWRRTLEREPDASGRFDVYRLGRTLTYVREPCSRNDIRDHFFLHVWRKGAAADFANLDFDFHNRGALFDGRCVAVAALPDDAPERIATGQFAPESGPLWQVGI